MLRIFRLVIAVVVLSTAVEAGAEKPKDAVPQKADSSAQIPAGAVLRKKFKDAAEADQFVAVLRSKQVTMTQLDVLQSLVKEKQFELERFNGDLSSRFGIAQSADYEFDAESGSIMQVIVSTNATKGAGATNNVSRKLLRKLDKADEVRDFVRSAAARNVTREEIAAFALVIAEKNLEMEQTEKKLVEQYGISNKSAYQYIAGELAVYELPTNSPPAKGDEGRSAVAK